MRSTVDFLAALFDQLPIGVIRQSADGTLWVNNYL